MPWRTPDLNERRLRHGGAGTWSDIRHLLATVRGGIVDGAMDMNASRRTFLAVAAGALLVVAGVLIVTSGGTSDTDSQEGATTRTIPDIGATASVDPVDPDSVFDPVRAGEETPPTYRQLLARDQIAPIYDPTFTSADDADWPLEVLIVGVEGPETAKAYPVSHLNRHEMVIDHIDGDPILVTW